MPVPRQWWFDKTKKTPDINLVEFIRAYMENDAIWFRLGCGAHKQLFDKAVTAWMMREVIPDDRGPEVPTSEGEAATRGTS